MISIEDMIEMLEKLLCDCRAGAILLRSEIDLAPMDMSYEGGFLSTGLEMLIKRLKLRAKYELGKD